MMYNPVEFDCKWLPKCIEPTIRGLIGSLLNATECDHNNPLNTWLTTTQRLMTLVATNCTPFKQFKPLLMPMAAAALTAISRPKNRQ